ncbi:CoxG family protein [Ancylobacter oerskovii]|uniref:CoxG family protein n=1 Tax=Ancylobacter oerskovii TaxID=459519 RepID=A0ABW4Z1U3_9HYPH|nr:carbon monoxide dehydrogenase subunit G [Ancylobacter oerskovii]MBS7544864.1 carbon monoxide dehydrogenase subunit G [Ancylobacter oerskovii]
MDITGEHRIAAPRAAVWAALLDVETLKACIPGCKELEQTSPTSFRAKVQLKVGPVSALFAGSVDLLDIDAPKGCRIVGQGNGGVAGFAKGASEVALAEEGEATVLSYSARAEIGGKLAALGGRLVQATSRKLADQFFSAFAERLAPRVDSAVP